MKAIFKEKFNIRNVLFAVAAFSAAMLAGALTGQYGLGWHPCDLCIMQRYPYAAIIAIGLGAGFFLRSARAQWWVLLLCIVLLWVDAGIAFYHTGVELEWFKGPDACSNADSGEMTLEEMRRAILNAPLVSCSQAMAYVMGLSLAAWNTIFASIMAVVLMVCAVRLKKA